MTNLYFIRHAQADNSVQEDLIRPLTKKGLSDRDKVTAYLRDKDVHRMVSSPYRRAVDTIRPYAEEKGLTITEMAAFAERKIANAWIRDFINYTQMQWQDFDYKLADGESLGEVRKRTVEGINNLLSAYENENIVIGIHGTALSVILNYYDPSFTYDSFLDIINLTPWAAHLTFDKTKFIAWQGVNLLS